MRRTGFPRPQLERRVFETLLGEGILTSQGAGWRWQRRTAAPLFRPADLAGLVPAMAAAADAQLARWSASPAGSVHAIDRDMTRTAFHVISATMFAGSADSEAAAILRYADRALSTISWDIAAALLRFPDWLWYPGKHARRRAAWQLRAAVATILARRRAEGLRGDDLLARLARAQDAETGEPMSQKQLIDNLVTFLAAGHETTAKALTWTLYLLARAPEWQQRIRSEMLAVAGEGPVRAEHLDRLVATRAVLEEAMRLYPPAPVMTRQSARTTRLDGIAVPAGGRRHHPRIRGAPAQTVVGRRRPLRSGAVLARAQGQDCPYPVHALRLRGAHLHRLLVRHDGGRGDPRDAGSRRRFRVGRQAYAGAAAPRHAAAEGRHAAARERCCGAS